MTMFELKDAVYIGVYFISAVGVIFGLRGKLRHQDLVIAELRNIVYGDRGRLNIIDAECCKRNRDEVFTAIRHSEKTIEMLLNELRDIKENMVFIRVHMGIKSPNEIKGDDDKKI